MVGKSKRWMTSHGSKWYQSVNSTLCNVHLTASCTTLCLKKVPTFKFSVNLSNLNRFSKFLQCWKAYEICYKTVWHYPPHLRYVATLPWQIKNSNFLQIFSRCVRKCKHIAYLWPITFVIHPQILIFSVFKIASCSPYWLQIKFTMSLTCLHLQSICDTGNSSQQMSLQCLSTMNMLFSDKDKILIKTHKYSQNTVIRIKELKLVHLKCNLFALSSISAKCLQKIWIFNFPR